MLLLMLVLTGLSVSMSYNMTKEAVSSGGGGAGGGLVPWMAGYGPHGTVYRQPISGTLNHYTPLVLFSSLSSFLLYLYYTMRPEWLVSFRKQCVLVPYRMMSCYSL